MQTPRLGLHYPALSDIADVPADLSALAIQLDVSVPYGQGPLGNRPVSTPAVPGISGRMYLATDSVPNILYVDYGTGWQSVGFIADGSVGTAQIADHSVTQIKLAMPAVDTTELFDLAVTSAKIADLTIGAGKLSATLKPSQGAGAGVESLRALGMGAGLALSQAEIQNINRSGLLVDRPAASGVVNGTFFHATDQMALYRSNGAAWTRIGTRAGDLYLTLNNAAEPGRVLCQGQAWPAIDGIYADLFAKWGGATLPDLRGRVPVVVSPGGKALVDNVRDNDGRTAAQRNISHRHLQDPQTAYKDMYAPSSGSDWTGNVRAGATSGDADNQDYPAFYVVNAEAKL